MEILPYLLKLTAYWLMLYLCYALFLRRHTFFAWNRAYLVGSLLAAFALPLVPYPEGAPRIAMPTWFTVYEETPLAETATIEVLEADSAAESYIAVSAENSPEVTAAPLLDFADWPAVVYCLGVCLMATRLFRHLRGVYAFFPKNACLDMDDYRLYLLQDESAGLATLGSFSLPRPHRHYPPRLRKRFRYRAAPRVGTRAAAA